MRQIVKIARNEIRNLFYTPVAWFLLILFWVMCALYYTQRLYRLGPWLHNVLLESPDKIYINNGALTDGLITSPLSSMVADVINNLHLFIPLLTMGVISREFNAGTYKLLYASPVRLRQVVAGKFLGICIFNLLFMLILCTFFVTAIFEIKSIDYGLLLSTGLCVYLLLTTYTAIGFFSSSLTRYPVVSAILSIVILLILTKINLLWQQYEFVRDLTTFISLNKRTSTMLKGLITSKDVIYFFLMIITFTTFALFVLKGKVQSIKWYLKAGRFLIVIILMLTLGYISSRQSARAYLDVSARKTNTLHPTTQHQLKRLEGAPLEVTQYVNLLTLNPQDPYAFIGLPNTINKYLEHWEPYRRFKDDIQFKYVYYYAIAPGDSSFYTLFPGKTEPQIAGLVARAMQLDASLFIGPEEVRKIANLDSMGYQRGMKLTWKDTSVFINFYPSETGASIFTDAQASSEPCFNATFSRLLGDKMPRLGFVTGNLERSILKTGEREYYWLNSLYALGFDIDTLNLSTQSIPDATTTLILTDPKQQYSDVAMQKISRYAAQGRNLFILGEPGKQQVLNPVIRQFGMQLDPGQLVHPSFHNPPDHIGYLKTIPYYFLADEYQLASYRRFLEQFPSRMPDTIGSSATSVVGLSQKEDSGFVITPLFITQPKTVWQKMGKLVIDSIAPVFKPSEGDLQKESYPVAVKLTRILNGNEQRIVLAGDADFMSTLGVEAQQSQIRALFSWLNYNRFPLYVLVPFPKDNWLYVTPLHAQIGSITLIWIVPVLLFLIGFLIIIRRKRK